MNKKIPQLRWLAALLLLVAAMVLPSTAWAYNQPNGEGTKESPYQISNGDELYWFAAYVNGDPGEDNGTHTACAVLTDDIEVSGTWTPIMVFEGTFDGQGHTISGLRKNIDSGGGVVGLFESIVSNAEIRNVGIVKCSFSVRGGGLVGGICAFNEGTITNCYNTGSVHGDDGQVGGVCGFNVGTITNCYNIGSVNNGQGSGGICGPNNGTITNCYYLIGTATDGIYDNWGTGSAEVKTEEQFRNGEVAWLLNGERSEGAEENPLAWYQNIGVDSYPVLDSSHKTVYCGYKDCTLSYSNNPEGLSKNPVHHYDNGFCEDCNVYQPATLTTGKYDFDGNNNTKDEVYEIGNAGQLYWFAGLVNSDASVCDYDENTNPTGTQQNTAACAVLTANIVVNSGLAEGNTMLESLVYDTSGNVTNGSNFVAWTPIGFNYQNYTGTFDGKGYTVSGLYFNDTNKEKVGLFGYVDSGGKIANVGVLDSYFEFRMMGGGICGLNYGEINNCTNGGTVIGNSTGSGAGGVCGMNYGTVKDCKNTGSVSGTVSNIGGVCGFFDSGSIENCLNEGTVSGTNDYTGGVCGQAFGGAIKRSYNTASVSGNNAVGGVCGLNAGAALEDCYNTGNVGGSKFVGGVCGDYSSGYTIKNCYNTGAVSGQNNVGGVCGNNIGTITNCYYLSGTATGGINGEDATGSAESKSLMQFTSGEVAYLLNEGKAFGTQVWGQQLGVNDYPVLGSDYKVIRATRGDMDANGDYPYWATFSNQSCDSDLGGLNVYTAKVSNGVLTITRCSDKIVAVNEGVLVKGSAEYLNAKMLNTTSADAEANNDLVATPATAETITAGEGYTLYRLTYDDIDAKKDLGFYLGLVQNEIGEVTSSDGSQLNATPNKAYLKVATADVTQPSGAAARGFVIPGDDGETTGIECISVTNESSHRNGNADGIFDLQGRKVSKPTKGVYINNGKKVIIK
jgi:hypothetical protein